MPPLCQAQNKAGQASPHLQEALGLQHIHIAHQHPQLDCELPAGRAVPSICAPSAWNRAWHAVGISNVLLNRQQM